MYGTKWYELPLCPLTPATWTYSGSSFGEFSKPIGGLLDMSGRASIGASLTDDEQARSLNAMLPGIKANLSVINAIYELKDMKSLPQTFRRARMGVESIGELIRELVRTGTISAKFAKTSPIRLILKAAGDSYLQWEFNVSSLIRDIMSARAAMKNVGLQVKNLLANEGKVVKRHFKCALRDYTNGEDFYTVGNTFLPVGPNWTYHETNSSNGQTADGFEPPQAFANVLRMRRVWSYDLAEFYATMWYSFEMEPYVRENALMLGYLDSLGANLNPTIIWNAIPWSFVADWTIGIGPWLSQFQLRNIDPRTRILGYTCAIRLKRTTRVYINMSASTHLPGGEGQSVEVVEESYNRIPTQPNWYHSIELNGMNLKKFILGTALALTR